MKPSTRRRTRERPAFGLATRAALAGTAGSAAFLPEGLPGVGALGPAGETTHGLPLFQVSNFCYPDAASAEEAAAGRAFLYGRHGGPTVAALEAALADLEGADAALAFGSGMAALGAALEAALAPANPRVTNNDGPGEILASEGIYGGSTELVQALARQKGARLGFVPAWDEAAVAAAITPRTRVLLCETLSNPLLRVTDLPRLGRLCRKRGVALVVDATISTPLLARPLATGATFVVHSLSKYIGGHGDLIGGVIAGDFAAIGRARKVRTLAGGVLDPFAAWLAMRGLRTLPVRFERQCTTAARLARVLARQGESVRAVHYPNLPGHPDRRRAAALFGARVAPGAVVSFQLRSGAAARRFYDRVELIARAASFGEATSLLTHPATFSHKGLSPAERARLGIDDSLLRLSVGLEDPRDLEADIKQALAR